MSPHGMPADPRFAHLPPPPAPHPWWAAPPGPTATPPAPGSPVGTATPGAGAGRPLAEPGRHIEVDVRNLILALGVASLVAAAVSFVAVNWDAFDASMRASLLIGVSAVVVLLGAAARARRLAGTATALSWLTAVLGFVDLVAVQRAAFPAAPSNAVTAVGGGALFVLFLAHGLWQPGTAMRTGAAVAWMLGWWSAFAFWDVTGPDVWVLPLAALGGWLQWRVSADDPGASSWSRYGVALAFAAVPAVATALGDPNTLRPVVLIAIVTVGVLVGLRLRQLALVRVAGASLAILVGAQLVDVLRGVPGWAVFALVGVVLLAVGAGFEHRLRRNGRPGVE